ncbi:MAG: HAD-IIIA family hydrolase [Candidatus Omnitrophica bacterium]|nr:HAD-IIIA family hydrolase [Candidatus Omnitrophota bacterium]
MKVVFLDRDGVINQYPGDTKYVTCWQEFCFLPKSKAALKKLTNAGYKIFIVSNQAGVAKGVYPQERLNEITDKMLKELDKVGVKICGVYYCTHRDEDNCSCRKPKTGLLEKALKDYNIPKDLLIKSFFVGDSMRDIQTGQSLGCQTILVFSGKEKLENQASCSVPPDFFAKDLLVAVDLILGTPLHSAGSLPVPASRQAGADRGVHRTGKRMSLKIIVSYASAGSGHRRAAQAVYDCLKKKHPELNIIFIDILKYSNRLFANFYSRGYSLLVTHLRFVWAIGYYISCFRFVRYLFNFISRLNSTQFIKLMIREKADVILAMHFFPAEVVAYLKQKGKIDSRLVTVMTDFSLHPLWLFPQSDDYIVGLDYTRNCLIGQGIGQDRVNVLGIPIEARFQKNNKDIHLGHTHEVNKGVGLATALLVTGSFGFPFMEKIVDILCPEINLLVVCGKNQRLYNKLARRRYIGVGLFGFTEDMPRLMSQADIVITKAGGLTIAEALAAQLPLIFIGNIPGQETENAKILQSCGCAINAKNLKSLKKIIIRLKSHPEELGLMHVNIERLKKPDAAEEICRYIKRSLDLCSDSECKSIG